MYDGQTKFKTFPGALSSMFVLLVLTAFAAYKCFILYNRINPNITKQTFFRNLDNEVRFHALKMHGF